MGEFEEEELYDCEIYTNEVINSEEEETNEEEKNEEVILLCPHCGFVYKVSDPPKDYRGRKIDISDYLLKSQSGYFRCPLCSKVVPYQFITEEEYEIIVKANKKKEEERQKKQQAKQDRKRREYIKVNVAKFNKELTEIQEDLMQELNDGKISIEKFSYMYKSLAVKLYDKYKPIFENKEYRRNDKKLFDKYDLIDTINVVNNDVVQNYKEKQKEEDSFSSMEEELNDEIIQKEEIYQREYEKIFERSKIYSEDVELSDFISDEEKQEEILKSEERQRFFDKSQAELDIRHEKEKLAQAEKERIMQKLIQKSKLQREKKDLNLSNKSKEIIDQLTDNK